MYYLLERAALEEVVSVQYGTVGYMLHSMFRQEDLRQQNVPVGDDYCTL